MIPSVPTRSTLILGLAAALLGGCASRPGTQPVPEPAAGGFSAYEEGVPGGGSVETVELSARVVAIDHVQRTAVLRGANGEQRQIVVGPEARNFDRVEVGDLVTAVLTRELIIAMADAEAGKRDGAGEAVALAPVGAAPGGVMARTARVTGTVTAIDPEARTATLRFPNGSTRTFPVRPDIDLAQHEIGEAVTFQVTESIAIDVYKP